MEVTRVGGFLQSLDKAGKQCSITTKPSHTQTTQTSKQVSFSSEKETSKKVTPSAEKETTNEVSLSAEDISNEVSLSAEETSDEVSLSAEKETSNDVSLSAEKTSDEVSLSVEKETTEEISLSAKGMQTELHFSATDDAEKRSCFAKTFQRKSSLTESNGKLKKRAYFQWSSEDTLRVTSYFKNHVHKPGDGSKGPLPGFKEIEAFLDKNEIFPNEPLKKRQKINLVKTKIFNERKKYRSRKQFEVW